MRRPLSARSGLSALGIVALAAVATGVGLATAPGPAGVAWPASVAPIAAFVSSDRGLAFKRVVPVHLMSPRAFDARIAAQDAGVGAGQLADDRHTASEYRALGLLAGSVNLVRAEASEDAGTVLGYYDSGTKALYVRGSDLTPEVRVTIAHELTHALQDQYFGLDRLDSQATTNGEQNALSALEEGDAVLDEGDYLNSLPLSQQRLDAAEESGSSGGPAVPGIVDVEANIPYVLGPDMVGAIYAAGGNRGIDDAFDAPPTTELDVLNPVDYLGHVQTRTLAAPYLASGEREEASPGDFGALTLYLMLASRLDATTALQAADGWGGGSMVQFADGTRSCTRVDLAGRTAAATSALAGAVGRWAAALPSGQATVGRAGTSVTITACDPGAAAAAGPNSLDAALNVADERNQNEVDAIYAGAPISVAGCAGTDALGDRAILRAEAAQNATVGPSPAGLQGTIDRQTARLIAGCEPGPRS
ncbi:MAG: hypothetical protein ACLP9C_14350 [Acidimicrobiales bacterium]